MPARPRAPRSTARPTARPTVRPAPAHTALTGFTALTALTGVTTLLAGCATPVDVPPGVDASDPVCARVVRATPEDMLGLERREASAQASTAWGDPAVTFRCGVEPPPPTTDRCLSVELPDGTTVDWINPEAEAPAEGEEATQDPGSWTFVTYGREPAVEIVVPAGAGLDQPTAVLVELASAVDLVPPTRHCVGATDVGA